MKTGLDYTLVGDVNIPNLISTDTNYEIGFWGQRHADYLKEHKKSHYTTLLTTGILNSYLHDIDIRAKKMYDDLTDQLTEQEGVNEKLRADNQMEWIHKMNNIRNR